MSEDKSVLFVTDYGIYPELTRALTAEPITLRTEQLMRKAIKSVKKDPPDLLIAEFFHEPQFRDRVSNLESILSQIQRNSKKSKTLILVYPEHGKWLAQLKTIFSFEADIQNDAAPSKIVQKVRSLLESTDTGKNTL